MYVEGLSQILGTHGRAFQMPTGETFAPRRGPMHDVQRGSLFPQGKIAGRTFLVLAFQFACSVHQFVDVAPREFSVRAGPEGMLAVVFFHVEIHRSVRHVGIALVQDVLRDGDLFEDMPGGRRFDGRGQVAQKAHHPVEILGVALDDLHRFECLQTGFLGDLVLALVGIVLQVSGIGDVAHIAHLVTQEGKIPEYHIERHEGATVAQVHVGIHRRAAYVHAHPAFDRGNETFLFAREGIVHPEFVLLIQSCCHRLVVLFVCLLKNGSGPLCYW